MSNLVKFMHADMPGAPVLTGQVGSLITLLDACLKDGWGAQNASSVVVAGGIATATFGTAFPAEVMSAVAVSGATPSGLNGEKKVTAVTSTAISWDATGISDQTATGTISIRMAPLGWTKPFTGTNLAVYTSADAGYLGGLLRVDDTTTSNARVVGYEAMFDVNTGVNAFPTAAQQAGGLWWPKSSTTDATARKWLIAGDGRGFYYWSAPNPANSGYNGVLSYFGDILSRIAGDKYAYMLAGPTTNVTTSASAVTMCLSYNSISTSVGVSMARNSSGVVGAVSVLQESLLFGSNFNAYSGAFSSAFNIAFPNGPDNGVIISPTVLLANNSFRGYLPGWYLTPQAVLNAFSHRDIQPGSDDYAGKRLMVLKTAPPASGAYLGLGFLDLTGPWR